MKKSIYKVIFPSIIFLTVSNVHAEDIRYGYCTANFLVHDGGSSVNRKHPANTALPSDPISLNLVPT